MTGSFRTIAGVVTAIDPATKEIKINELEKKHPLTIVIKQDSVLRKFPAASEMGAMMGGFRGAGGGAGGPGGPGGAPPQGGQGQGQGARSRAPVRADPVAHEVVASISTTCLSACQQFR